jgi:hypothetical protein
MVFRSISGWLMLIAAAWLSGCSNSNSDDGSVTGKGSIRGIHAIPELGTVTFLIEETALGSLTYKAASGTAEYDDLNYDFNFDVLLPGDSEETRLATENVTVNAGTEYSFVLSGTLADPEIILWEQPGRDWAQELEDADDADTEVTVMEVSFGHLDTELGPVDVFFESPGTSPQSATPLGTIEYGDQLPATELTEGDYQLVVTPSGEPTTILFASGEISLSAATSNLFTIMDSAGLTTADFAVRWVGLGADLTDLFAESELSVVHAAFGTEALDIVVGDNFSNPLVSDLAYAEWHESVVIDDEPINLIVTPTGNPGVFLAQKEIDVANGSYNRLMLTGLPGLLQTVLLSHDERTLATHARVQIFQGAARFQIMDIYLVADNVDITLTSASYSSTLFGSGTGYQAVEGHAYNLYLTEAGTKNIIGGPFHLDLEVGRNYGIVIVDAPDITAADMLFFDQTPD